NILHAGLVDRARAEYGRLGQLYGLLCGVAVDGAARQRKLADASVAQAGLCVRVPAYQSVGRGQLIIQARPDRGAAVRCPDKRVVRRHVQVGIESHGGDNGVVVDGTPLEIDEKGRFFADGPADVAAELPLLEWRFGRSERIPGVEYIVAVIEESAPTVLVRSRLGEDLDATITQALVFGGEGILIDAYFADRFLRWKPPAREAVNIDLASVGASAGTGKGLQVGSQIVRVVGEHVEIGAFENQGAGVVRRIDIHPGLFGDGDLLFVQHDDQRGI